MTIAQRRAALWTAVAAIVAALVALVAIDGDGGGAKTHASHRTARPVYHMHADHLAYASIDDLTAASDLVVVGHVASHTTDPSSSPGDDGAGDPLPPIPHTDYSVNVDRVLKGSAGSVVVVSLSGGTSPDGRFVLDGGPLLNDGDTEMFFLQAGSDGKYYPLAGGAAVADRQSDGSYILTPDATGGAPLSVTEAAVQGGTGSKANPGTTGGPSVQAGPGSTSGGQRGGSTATVAKASHMAIVPRAFHAARSGPPVLAARRSRKAPTKVSYRLNMDAVVRVFVSRAVPGRLRSGRGSACVAVTKKNRRGHRCTRFLTLPGGFTTTGKAGSDSFGFTGRLGGRKLAPGNYVLSLTPSAGGDIGRPVRTAFRILR